ncbi:LysR family transcriptional regulator [Leisingera daeponensis]|uniref:LysR family transcriptional regulator n=1 Tax=Leisingera daeponensis TaxID=405746 RepID=UPI001C981C92|nr:LysR family transcriptional regulator [Leisingera daeponensis]MBY6059400.1 LysR family transcriptional regulator [Leisingera daeponensis]
MSLSKNFDLVRALECYVSTVHAGNMSESARKLGITQSAISQQIKNLEELLGSQLIDRSLRPLRPTSAGVQLLEKAERLLDDANQLLSSSRNFRKNPLLRLRLSMLSSFSQILAPHIVQGLREELPVENIVVTSGLASTLRMALLNRETDIALTSDPLLEIDSLERHDVLVEPFVLLLPATVDPEITDLQELGSTLPLMRYHANSPIGTRIETHLRRQRIQIDKWCEFDSPDSVVSAVEEGFGWAITSPMHILQGVRNWQRIRCIPLPGPEISRVTVIVARRGELQGIPLLLAQMTREILSNRTVPVLLERISFLEVDRKAGGTVHITVPPT